MDDTAGAVEAWEYADERFKSPRDAHRYWTDALAAADKAEDDWRRDAERASDIYDQGAGADSGYTTTNGGRAFNILHSNTQTIVAAAYNSTPLPDVRSKGRTQDLEADPVADGAAELMERGIAQQLDVGDFDGTMLGVITQAYVAGRGVSRIRYETYQHADKDAAATGTPPIAFEEIQTELVDWRDFRRGPARAWKDVPWVAFRIWLSRADVRKLLTPDDGEADEEEIQRILHQIPFETPRITNTDKKDEKRQEVEAVGKAECWEIWDKEARAVWFHCPGYGDAPLAQVPDPFELVDFYPCPQPLEHTPGNGSLVPLCPYEFYRAQAEELETTSERIRKLTECLKWRGIRASEITEIEEMASKADGEFVPSQGALSVLAQGKGLDAAIWTMPLDQLIVVIRELALIREQQKAAIYEITGIADIMRGATDANETLGAQQIKAQWGSLRVQRFQRGVQRVCRDLFRMMAHLIANVFNDQTVAVLNGRPVAPEVMQMLRSDFMMQMRVDVETDSTVRGDLNRIQEEQSRFLEATGGYISAVAPVVASPANPAGFVPPQVVVEIFGAFARSFRLGRSVEEVLSKLSAQAAQAAQQPQPEPPNPEQQKLEADQQAKQADLEMRKAEMQLKAQEKQQEMQMRAAEHAQEMQIRQAEAEQARRIEAAKMAIEAERMDREDARAEREMAFKGETEGKKLEMQERQAARADDATMRREYLKSGLPPGFDHNAFRSEIEADLEDEMQKGLEALAQAIMALAKSQQEQTQAIMAAVTAPKEVIRDENGRAVGVRTAERMN